MACWWSNRESDETREPPGRERATTRGERQLRHALKLHAGPVALFAALAVGWTWPLAIHLGDAIPGAPGDNFSFVWNLWWMRHVLATPGLAYFHTAYLFYPFGTTIADHPHTALPAMIAATALKSESPAAAQDVLLLTYVFLNMASAYALCWAITKHRRGAILGGLIFGLSPYLASHLLGHFDLVAAWPLPLFALALRKSTMSNTHGWAAAAGLILAATAYIAYYYVVYLLFFLACYLFAWLEWPAIRWTPRSRTFTVLWIMRGVTAGMIVLAAVAIWIAATGGTSVTLRGAAVSMRAPQNALTAIWIGAAVYALCIWKPAAAPAPSSFADARRSATIVMVIGGIFIVGAAPLLWQAAQLIARGEYVTPAYQWRSAPRGVDLLAPLLGPPLHPWFEIAGRAYTSVGLDRTEAVGWLGIVPLILIGGGVVAHASVSKELRMWRVVAIAFGVWALGPILTVGGFDTGLRLPAILLRYVPFVANARIPGRAMVVVFMALAVLASAALVTAPAWRRRAQIQWLLIALIAFEYWDSPIPMTRLDRPAVYEALGATTPGAVCEVPFGIGDGLSAGFGSQDRRALYYATVHAHPLVGGYIGRMPADAVSRYEEMPMVGTLLRLSDGRAYSGSSSVDVSPCEYLVVNRDRVSQELRAYIGRLPLDRIASDDVRDLYRVKSGQTP